MSWTFMFSVKAVIFFLIAICMSVHGSTLVPAEYFWAFIATYALTGVVFVLIGMLLDARESNKLPQKVEVLLRHDGLAWLLTVMRNHTGELYAPLDERMRTMKPVKLSEVSEDILGCPRYARCAMKENVYAFRVLGKKYISKA